MASLAHMTPSLSCQLAQNIDAMEDDVMWEVTVPEVFRAMRGMSLEVAAGPDRARLKTIKTYDPEGKVLTKLFNICFRFKYTPTQWKTGSTFILSKPGKGSSRLNNRRPITVSAMTEFIAAC